ncbi:uncharacterized protein LOC135401486 [Ornithodoros turicata]|uniref:uncharacterized protein LOC135401486 n=1 Tax=Ornithodoros turicata TaxID=34597 RepID=UPI00313A1665
MSQVAFFEYSLGITFVAFLLLYMIEFLWAIVGFIAVIGVSLTVGVKAARVLIRVRDNNQVPPIGKAVFVTGCDVGYGRNLAVELANRGFRVFACVSHGSPERQGELKTLKTVTVLEVDTRQDLDIIDAVKTVQEQATVLWALVLTEGISYIGEVEWEDITHIQKVHEINVFGVLRVVRAFLPMIRRNHGRLVFVGGYAGRMAFPGMVPYCMTKAAIISLSDGLRRECRKWGIRVSVIHPFYYKTYDTPEIGQVTRRRSSVHQMATVPADVLEVLGDDYLLNYRQLCERRLELFARHDLRVVVNAIMDAVMHVHSKTYYECVGPVDNALWWALEALPIEFQDFCMAKMLGGAEFKKGAKRKMSVRRRQSAITVPLSALCGSGISSISSPLTSGSMNIGSPLRYNEPMSPGAHQPLEEAPSPKPKEGETTDPTSAAAAALKDTALGKPDPDLPHKEDEVATIHATFSSAGSAGSAPKDETAAPALTESAPKDETVSHALVERAPDDETAARVLTERAAKDETTALAPAKEAPKDKAAAHVLAEGAPKDEAAAPAGGASKDKTAAPAPAEGAPKDVTAALVPAKEAPKGEAAARVLAEGAAKDEAAAPAPAEGASKGAVSATQGAPKVEEHSKTAENPEKKSDDSSLSAT